MTNICGICDLRHLNNPSVVWCKECEEGLCLVCKEHHSLSKATRKHKTIPTSEYRTSPAFFLEQEQFCSEHNEKYQIFCKVHRSPCCSKCVIEQHKECKDITNIDDLVQNTKSSNHFQETEQLISEVIQSIKQIRKGKETDFANLKKQRKVVEREIQQTRNKINDHLDRIQETLMKQLYKAEHQAERQSHQLLTSLHKIENDLHQQQTKLENIKQHASDLQSFLIMKKIESNVVEKEKVVQSLVEDGSLNQTVLRYKIDTTIQNFLSDIEKFGHVTVETKPYEMVIARRKTKEPEVMMGITPLKGVENVTVKLQKTVNTFGDVYGCCLLPDGKMVFSGYSKERLTVINNDGSLDFHLGTAPSFACGVAPIKRNKLAITSGGYPGHVVSIVDLKKKSVTKRIQTGCNSDGIVYMEESLIFCAREEGIKMINLHDDRIINLVNCKLSMLAGIASYDEKLFYTDYDNQTVTCCDIAGNTLWEFRNPEILGTPQGITIDEDGNIYVVDVKGNGVVVLSADGQHHKQLLSAKDGLNNPQVLYFDRQNNKLLVANATKNALLFNVW